MVVSQEPRWHFEIFRKIWNLRKFPILKTLKKLEVEVKCLILKKNPRNPEPEVLWFLRISNTQNRRLLTKIWEPHNIVFFNNRTSNVDLKWMEVLIGVVRVSEIAQTLFDYQIGSWIVVTAVCLQKSRDWVLKYAYIWIMVC